MSTESENLATAYEAWDKNWTSDDERNKWLEPDPLVRAMIPLLEQRGFSRLLDLGCGVGRHAHYLVSQGFTCVGIDGSESGLAWARERAAVARLAIDYRVGTFYDVPLADRSFEAIIAWNVIYHGDHDIAQQAVDEIARLLVPGGLYVGTMLSKRNIDYGQGREVRPGTFVIDDADNDHVHPHYYCDGAELMDLHRGFEVLNLRDHNQGSGHNHWEFTFERRS
jgi:SAM-dependent methyltransferase